MILVLRTIRETFSSHFLTDRAIALVKSKDPRVESINWSCGASSVLYWKHEFGHFELTLSSLAYVEMRIILARVLWNFDLTIAEDSMKWQDEEEVYTLWLKGELNFYLTPRE